MNTMMRRRIAAVGTALVAGAALAVGGGAPATAGNGSYGDNGSRPSSYGSQGYGSQGYGSQGQGSHGYGSVTESYRYLRPSVRVSRWIRVAELDSRRQCERAGIRGERRGAWSKFRCVRDWDRDWDRNDWDRRGSDWRECRDNWNRRGRHHSADYTLYVKRSWHY